MLRLLTATFDSAAEPPDPARPRGLLEWTEAYLPGVGTDTPADFHRQLCAELDAVADGSRCVVVAPRGSAKSSFASYAWPLREALEGRRRMAVILSDTAGQARRFLGQIRREVESNQALKAAYKGACEPGAVWRDDWLMLANGCELAALSVGGKIRGLKSASNRRPDLVILDDVLNKDHAQSPLRRERAREWLFKDVLPAGSPQTAFFCVGTPLHREDVIGALSRAAGWSSRRFRSVESWPERLDLWEEFASLLHSYDLDSDEDGAKRLARAREFYEANRAEMDRGARVLWPSRWPLWRLMAERAMLGGAAFESEYNCDPVDPAACEWPQEYLDRPGMYFDEWPDGLLVRTIALDPSKGADSNQGDYSAIVRFGVDRFGVEYVEADLARRTTDRQCDDLARHTLEFKPDGVAVETNQFQELLLVPIRAAAQQHGVEIPVYRVDNSVHKDVRIRRLTTPLAQRRVRFKSRSPGTQLLIQQMRDWPGGAFDDGPDALEGARRLAVRLLRGKQQARPAGPKGFSVAGVLPV